MSTYTRLLQPKSVAVIGASDDLSKTRGKILHCLKAAGFEGAIWPVNPSASGPIQGLAAYPSLAAVPGIPDLLLIGIPGAGVPALIEEAAECGCGAAVVFSSDVDPAAMTEAVAAARRRGLCVLGPNTEGFFVPRRRLAASFAHVVEECLAHPSAASRSRRPIAVVSQSGGIGFALFGRAYAAHLDLQGVYTTGNEAGLDVLDLCDELIDGDEVGVILLYIEGLKDARRLAVVAEHAAARGIPIVVMKVGRSEAGQRAAVSHTAHLAGADTAYDALFARYGLIRVDDVEEMLAAAAALSLMPVIEGGRVAIVTTSGGAGGWAADLLSARGLEVPALGEPLQRRMMSFLPPYASPANPVDTTVAATDQAGRGMIGVLDSLASSGEVDAVVLNMGLSARGRIAGMADRLAPLIAHPRVPLLFHSHILPAAENLSELARLGAHAFPSFRACAAGIAALRSYGAFQARRATAEAAPRRASAPAPLFVARDRLSDGVLDADATAALLAHYRIPVPPSVLARDAAEARAAGAEMGWPVALKIRSPDIAHKTEVGGVELAVTEVTLDTAFGRLLASVARHAPAAGIEGVQVQKMMPPGTEVVIGVVADRDIGPLVMLGLGGVYVEVLKDVVFAPPPIGPAEAKRMIHALQASAILKGARGRPPADLDALAHLIVAVAELATDGDGVLDQLDLNPVLVYPEGQGVVAVDALVALATPRESSHG